MKISRFFQSLSLRLVLVTCSIFSKIHGQSFIQQGNEPSSFSKFDPDTEKQWNFKQEPPFSKSDTNSIFDYPNQKDNFYRIETPVKTANTATEQQQQGSSPPLPAPQIPTATPSATPPVVNAAASPIFTPQATTPPLQNPESRANNEAQTPEQKGILVNFNNISMGELLRYISRISNKNFIFDENDIQFNVTIVSEEMTTLENLMTAILQELRIHDLSLLEQGNNLIIHKNPRVGSLNRVISEDLPETMKGPLGDIVTQVFRLNSIDVETAATLLRPMLSEFAIVSIVNTTNHIIVTDLTSNIRQIDTLLKSVDSPSGGLVIGQYVVRNALIDTLIQLADTIIRPISQDQPLIFVPHAAANSIFIVSTPYFVERTISILQYLDQTQGTTQILNPKDLNFNGTGAPLAGRWRIDEAGLWHYETTFQGEAPPVGKWSLDNQGNWKFEPGIYGREGEGPEGRWERKPRGWSFLLAPGKAISPERLMREQKFTPELPVGNLERTKFYLYKLLFRRGDQIVIALSRIAESLQMTGTTNQDLVSAIGSIQWIESSNSLVFTGTSQSISKIKELIEEIDVPLRQVFLEMLILETTVDDSLNFSVNEGARFGGGRTAGNETFISAGSTIPAMLNSTGPNTFPNPAVIQPNQVGFSLGIIGETLTHNGTHFATLAALVRAVDRRDSVKVILNPKILTEDNSPAEIFVGENTQFPTQSIANNYGLIVTQNFEFRDVGIRLRVTPLIGNNDLITLDIQEEVSRVISGGTQQINNLSQQVIGPTTTVSRTTTKVHVPDGYFLVLSGAIRDAERRLRVQTPCLGGIPIIGAAFSDKLVVDEKRNLMIFIHPRIIDTEEQIQNLTKHQQDIYRMKNRRKSVWKYETEEALDFLNLEDIEDTEGEFDRY